MERGIDMNDTAQRFVDCLCHEFRTPLTVIKEYACIAEQGSAGPVTGRQREFLRIISDTADDMARLVEDLLDACRMREGRLHVDRGPCEVSEILDPVAPAVAVKAAERPVRFSQRVVPGLGEVFADVEKIRRAVVNLAVTAVKLCPAGGEVILWARPDEGGARIGITVQGLDIRSEEMNDLLLPFRRIVGGAGVDSDGLRPGLVVAAELIRLNLGKLRVVGGAGSRGTVSFALPGTDPGEILGRYFDHLADAGEPARVYAFRVEQALPGWRREAVRSFLSSACHATDLVLPAGGDDSLLVIGPSGSVASWIDRLRSCWSDAVGSASAGPLAVEPIGCWSFRRQRLRAQSYLAGMLCREAACG